MDLEIVERRLSTLPEDDDHPYRTGTWQPQTKEWDANDLQVVEGAIPTDVDGVYLRNTENPAHPAIARYHPFDGDGMIHAVGFRDGRAFYRNRFIRTDGFQAEQEVGKPLWAGLAERPTDTLADYGWGARTMLKDSSSTDVAVHNGVALTSFYQCGDLYRLDPMSLQDLGKAQWGGKFPFDWGVSAHPKPDDRTGELLFFNYSTEAPYMNYGVVDANNELVHYTPVPLPGPRLPHDMAFTENYAILNDCPMFWDPEALRKGAYAVRFHEDMPTRIGVIPRRGGPEDIRWFEGAATYVLHWTNAYEDGDEIVLDGFFQDDPSPADDGVGSAWRRAFRFLANDLMKPRLHRWRLNMVTGQAKEEPLTDSISEFGMINAGFAGSEYRYVYSALNEPGWFLFNGILKHDTWTGTEQRFMLEEGVFASETSVAPRVGSTGEDDAYLVTITSDMNADASYCLLFDAKDITAGPVCKLKLPERVSSGTHSTWAQGSQLPGWDTAEDPSSAMGM